jgi:2-aminomuconate deaminase
MNNTESKVLSKKAVPRGNFPHVKRAGDFIYVSFEGVAVDEFGVTDLDIRAQTRAVIENIKDILNSMDAALEDLLELTCFLVNMNDFGGFNEVYSKYFGTSGPARTTVAVHQLPHPHLLIEIKAIAYKPITKRGLVDE